jgi:putative transposase
MLWRKPPRVSTTPTTARDDDWLQARRYARELDKVLDSAPPRRLSIARAAAELGVSTRQIYNLLKRYAVDRSVSALLRQKGRTRRKRLAPEIEAIIVATLREQWLVLERRRWRLSSHPGTLRRG